MRVAIVGAGVSGLVAAHLLHRRHEVTVFEASGRIGGHARTVDVDDDGRRLPVDTGFLVYNERNYPRFTALLAELGVAGVPTTMSFSVRCDRTGIEYGGASLDALFAQRRNALRPSFWGMLADLRRFYRDAPRQIGVAGSDATVDDFATAFGYGEEFLERHLVPLGSAIWSAPPGAFRRFPIRFVVEFLANHDMLRLDLKRRVTWRTIPGGSRHYVEKLAAPFADRILAGTPVREIRRGPDAVTVAAGAGGPRPFDHVILACHADQALRVLADPRPREREILGAVPYARNDAALHTDEGLLPSRRAARAAWNYHVRADDGPAAVTYDLNLLQRLGARRNWCVTLNENDRVRPAAVHERIVFEHPSYTTAGVSARARRSELLAVDRTSYCGAYWGAGFHEDGVESAFAAVRALEAAA